MNTKGKLSHKVFGQASATPSSSLQTRQKPREARRLRRDNVLRRYDSDMEPLRSDLKRGADEARIFFWMFDVVKKSSAVNLFCYTHVDRFVKVS